MKIAIVGARRLVFAPTLAEDVLQRELTAGIGPVVYCSPRREPHGVLRPADRGPRPAEPPEVVPMAAGARWPGTYRGRKAISNR